MKTREEIVAAFVDLERIIDQSILAMDASAARIEALEAALLTAFSWLDPDCVPDEEYRKIRAALAPEQDR